MKACYVKIEGSEEILKVCVSEDIGSGDYVLLNLKKGVCLGKVITDPVEDGENLPSVQKKICEEELKSYLELKKKEPYAMEFCKKKAEELGLPIKLLKAEYLFQGTKLIFYFFSEGRVDFRGLVKELAKEFKTRIEMRQVGVRDEVRFLGGLGNCGDVVCCKRFLTNFSGVSIKMIKEQGLMLNPSKVSGLCGRLMCCLAFEYPMYKELKKDLPKIGKKIETSFGKGKITKVDIIKRQVTVRFEDGKEVFLPIEKIEEVESS